jgi:TRAP-type C4-dicarboxylate transport system substrate-binding protein
MRKLWDEREAAAEKKVTEAGAVITRSVDRGSFLGAMKTVYEKFAGTPALQALVKQVREAH